MKIGRSIWISGIEYKINHSEVPINMYLNSRVSGKTNK